MREKVAQTVIRYSPKPMADYSRRIGATQFGPASMRLLDSPQAWNLAFLSHDFENEVLPGDPQFSVIVRRTLQTKLDGTGADLTADPPYSRHFGSYLGLPAPRFAHLVANHQYLHTLPMFQAFGPEWLKTIDRRSRLCLYEDVPDVVHGTDFTQARQALAKAMGRS